MRRSLQHQGVGQQGNFGASRRQAPQHGKRRVCIAGHQGQPRQTIHGVGLLRVLREQLFVVPPGSGEIATSLGLAGGAYERLFIRHVGFPSSQPTS